MILSSLCLHFFPDRGHLPKGLHDTWKLFNDVIHFFFPVGSVQAQPQRAVGDLLRHSDGQQHVARFQGAGSTCGSRGCAYSLEIQPQKQGFSLIFRNFGNVLTEPEWRQRGLLNRLLDCFIRDFTAEPVAFLCCGSDNPYAIRSYRRYGFYMLYGGESGLMCLGKRDFFEEAARCYPGPGAVTIRPGTIADQFECDRFLACIPAMQSVRAPGADSGIRNYRTAFQECLSGRACVMVAENETGSDAGYAFAAVTPGGDRLDLYLHPDYLPAGPELLRRTAAEFRRRFGRTPLLAAAPEDAVRRQLASEAEFIPAQDSVQLFRPPEG